MSSSEYDNPINSQRVCPVHQATVDIGELTNDFGMLYDILARGINEHTKLDSSYVVTGNDEEERHNRIVTACQFHFAGLFSYVPVILQRYSRAIKEAKDFVHPSDCYHKSAIEKIELPPIELRIEPPIGSTPENSPPRWMNDDLKDFPFETERNELWQHLSSCNKLSRLPLKLKEYRHIRNSIVHSFGHWDRRSVKALVLNENLLEKRVEVTLETICDFHAFLNDFISACEIAAYHVVHDQSETP